MLFKGNDIKAVNDIVYGRISASILEVNVQRRITLV
jgi:hypothetical protein